VRQVIELPPRPYGLAVVAGVLFLLAVVAAVVGVGHGSKSNISPGRSLGAKVAGFDPAEPLTVRLDLSKPILVQLSSQPNNVKAIQIGFRVAGVPLPPSTTRDLVRNPDSKMFEASVIASADRYLVGGTVTGDLRFIGEGGTVYHQQFLATVKQPPLLTAPGCLVVLLFVVFVSYMASLLHAQVRGRRLLSGLIGSALLGAGVGATIVGLNWLRDVTEPTITITTVIVCALFGSGAGIAASLAAIRIAKRIRIRPTKLGSGL
jgi:hypothetical protein